jgi:uncharacterized membrane protein
MCFDFIWGTLYYKNSISVEDKTKAFENMIYHTLPVKPLIVTMVVGFIQAALAITFQTLGIVFSAPLCAVPAGYKHMNLSLLNLFF